MATEPVIENIGLVLVDRIEQVTIANGYQQDVEDVVRPTRKGGFTPRNYLVLVQQEERNRLTPVEQTYLATHWQQKFRIALMVLPSDKDPTPIDTLINRFQADVEKAIAVDSSWQTFGGYARNAWFDDPGQLVNEDGVNSGVVLELNVQYMVQETDPYTQR